MSPKNLTIVALVGPKRVGKDTIARQLLRAAEHRFNHQRLGPQHRFLGATGSFAERLRYAASAAYGLDTPKTCGGVQHALFWDDRRKEERVLALNCQTPRQVLIHLGAAMRAVDVDIWCRGGFEDLVHKLRCHLPPDRITRLGVLTDMRFSNEMHYGKAWCAARGFHLVTVGVHRDQAPAPGLDSADQEACALRSRCDILFDNHGDLADLDVTVDSLLDKIESGMY